MKALKTALLGAIAVGALAASPASAFDNVDWNWHNDVREHVDIDVDIDIDLKADGLVQVEKLQMFFGDVTAESKVSHVVNNQPGGVELQTNGYNPFGGKNNRFRGLNFCLPQCNIEPPSFDARYELPEVISTATAVGNNQSITSTVPVFLHDAQFLAGGFRDWGSRYTNEGDIIAGLVGLVAAGLAFDAYADDNLHTGLALAMTAAAAGGIIKKSDIEATSSVSHIVNASVDSAATAVANNISVTVQPEESEAGLTTLTFPGGGGPQWPPGGPHVDTSTASNNVVIADITQWAYADVSATSTVCDVELSDYTHLGEIDRAIVSSVATAVGNNVSISVGVPSID